MNSLEIEAAHTNIFINITTPTIEKFNVVIKQLNVGKAAASYSIPAKALDSYKLVIANIFHIVFRKILKKIQAITNWKEGDVI